MLEFMKLRLDGSGVGESVINIWMRDGRLRYSYDRSQFDTQPPLIVKVPQRIADDFLQGLQSIHVNRWKGFYQPPKNSKKKHLRDVSWMLLYKEEEKEPLQFGGENAFPKAWDTFFGLLSRLVNETEAMHLNKIGRVEFCFRHNKEISGFNPVIGEEVTRTIAFSETLTLDRGEKKILYVRSIGENTVVSHEYKIPEIIDYLLGNCERYFRDFQKDGKMNPDPGKPQVSVSIYFRNGKVQAFRRSYDRYGVPDDWDELLEDIRGTISFYGLYGSLFDPGLYQHGVKNGEHIYLSCIQEPDGESLFYRTLDDTLEVGDLVIVPGDGQVENERIVMISDIRYYTPENVPYPLEKTKFILRKFDLFNPEEWNEGITGDEDDQDYYTS